MRVISEYKLVDGEMKFVAREMTAEEEAELPQFEDIETEDPLTKMITSMSTASTLAQMRNAAKEFLSKQEE